MKYNKDYFYIKPEHLKDKIIFPFQLYVFNKVNKEHTLYLYANSPLDKKKRELLLYIINRGGEIAIKRGQAKTFLSNQEINEADIPSLKKTGEHQLQKNQKMYLHLYEKRQEEKPFIFKDELKKASEEEDYSYIIEEARSEILTFEVTVNETVSLAVYLAETLLTEDNYTNRIVAMSYFIAKTINIKDQESLGDLIVASFLAHIGLTQVEKSILEAPLSDFNPQVISQYRKHPALSQHLLRKCGVKLSDRCLKAIIEHHERVDGSGFPSNKVEGYIEPLALIVGVVSHMFEHTIGHHDGTKRALKTIIANLGNRSVNSGLELEFGDKILEGIENLLA